jgi:galactofuranosylgalactofuranosylrhamnosyl-N-acetylglucosaminyl-diphospho-decaprenol beta-1,5/1,6-galactofuranosyltransferase
MAIWHVPWTEKDDALDWQGYYHQRNRMVSALLHSPFPRGGHMVRESFNNQVKHLISMQYSTAELRLRALEDVLSGPEHLHRSLATTLPEVRAIRAGFPDAQSAPTVRAFPAARRRKPRRKDREPLPPKGLAAMTVRAAAAAVRQLLPVEQATQAAPQAAVPAMDAQWWRLAVLDSAIVSTTDGTSMSWYRRDPALFSAMMRRTVAVHERLLQEWPSLSRRYRAAAAELSSPQRWAQTFEELEADASGSA